MIVVSIFFYIYIICILVFIIGFDKIKFYKNKKSKEETAFSVVIPFRNEAQNLPDLLKSIQHLDYPKTLVEFIFIDDESTDGSLEITQTFKTKFSINSIQNHRISNSPKKDAITAALKIAKNDWIITTDADCISPKNWLKTIDNFIQHNQCNMIVAPVNYKVNGTFLHQFQQLDFMSLQASTISGFGLKQPFLSNGANLIYNKIIFEKVNGFDGNNTTASGDDIFLLEKFLNHNKNRVAYLKSNKAIVQTFPVNSWKELVQQRVRWASKTSNYNLPFGKLVGLIVFLGNLTLVITPFLVYFKEVNITNYVSFLILKLFFDYLLLERIAKFQKNKIDFLTYMLSSFLYPFFIVLVVCFSFFSKYKWKGRSFRK